MSDWQEGTARSARRSRPPSAPHTFELHVVEGPDAGQVFTLESSSCVLVGSSKLCAIRLSDETIAARHCSLERVSEQVRLLDLSPGKATRVNGVCAHEAFLVGGEVLRIGATAIALKRVEQATLSAPAVTSFGRIHGDSLEMLALYDVFAMLANERRPLLIEGERGVGKRLLAEELHAHGPWKEGPFVVVPRREEVAAHVLAARGGTLYVEEGLVPDLALVPSDVRVIFAARIEPAFGASIQRVTLPPLRARAGDVAVLARHFWAELGGEGALPDDLAARFEEHAWPGNVRELRIAVEDRLRHGVVTVSDVFDVAPADQRPSSPPDALAEVLDHDLPFVRARNEVLAAFERRYVIRALERAGHNVARAAANSGIAHRYFQVLKSRRKNA